MTTICCVCQKTKNKNRWVKASQVYAHKLSHGYCPGCFKRLMKKLDAHTAGSDFHDTVVTA